MTLQTHEELDLIRRVKRIEEKLDALFILCDVILFEELKRRPTFRPTSRIKVTPTS